MTRKRTIGVLSKATGVKVTTIRYYESIGLIEMPDRSEGGQRVYDEQAVERLTLIRHARQLGFTTEAIRNLIQLDKNADHACHNAGEIARQQLADVEAKIEALTSLKQELNRMLDGCKDDKIEDCQVIKSLYDHACCQSDHKSALIIRF